MPIWVASALKKIGNYLGGYFLDYLISWISAALKSWKKKQEQSKIDKENLDRYTPVKEGKLSDEEDIKRTEDMLNGRRP